MRHRPKPQSAMEEEEASFDLIKEEMAIMKKLNHGNLVSLIEVLDDPDEDSLYMVLEMCKKGVVMHVEVDQDADPYDEETCRCWFRDMILGIEYCKQLLVRYDLSSTYDYIQYMLKAWSIAISSLTTAS